MNDTGDALTALHAFANLMQLRFDTVPVAQYVGAVQDLHPMFLAGLYPYDGVKIAESMAIRATPWLTEPATYDQGGEARLLRFLTALENLFLHMGTFALPLDGSLARADRASLDRIDAVIANITAWVWRTPGNNDMFIRAQLIEKLRAAHVLRNSPHVKLAGDLDGLEPRDPVLLAGDIAALDASLHELFNVRKG